MTPSRFPGRFRFVEGEQRSGPHVGWFARGVGLCGLSGTVRVALQPPVARVGTLSAIARDAGCSNLERIAGLMPCVFVPPESAYALEIEWSRASNSGRITTPGGRSCQCTLGDYRLEPMAPDDDRSTVDFLTADWDCDAAWRVSLVADLTRGVEVHDGTELELPEALCPSLDRIIRFVSNGALDEEAVELALHFEACARASSWLTRTFFRERSSLLQWEREIAARLTVQPPAWTPAEGTSPWGSVKRLRLPAILLSDDTRLPAEERLLFGAAPSELDDDV